MVGIALVVGKKIKFFGFRRDRRERSRGFVDALKLPRYFIVLNRTKTPVLYSTSRLNATPQGYLSINTKNPPTVDFGNLHVNAYIDVRHLEATRLLRANCAFAPVACGLFLTEVYS